MSSFYGSHILFDGKSSIDYNLRISNFETGGTSDGNAGSEPTLYQKYIYRRTSPYYFGRSLHNPLEFNITLSNFDNDVSALDRNEIFRWLIGRSDYKQLSIVQDDMEGIIFNAMIDKPVIKYVGNIARGVSFNVKCKEPWGFESVKTITKNYVGILQNDTFNFYNSSAHDDYLYPLITFTNSSAPLTFQLINQSESNRTMTFTNLTTAGDIITVDCDRQIISSYQGNNLMTGFNKIFFRLVPGMNSIQIVGNVSQFTMTYQFSRKIGG